MKLRAANLGRVHPERARGHVDDALAHEGGLEAAGRPVGAGRRLVRHDAGDLGPVMGNAVGAGEVRRPCCWARWRRACGRRRPCCSRSGRGRPRMVPSRRRPMAISWCCSREWLAACRCSRRSSIQRTGRPRADRQQRDEEILGVHLAPDAEGAAHVGLQEVHRVLGQPRVLGDDATVDVRHLGHAPHAEHAAARRPSRPGHRGFPGARPACRCT